MQTATVLLSLGGDHGNQIVKHDVTAAEIAVLRVIHGDEAVTDVEPTLDVKRSNREERARLLNIYGGAKMEDNKPIVESMFPGVAARVFENLNELSLPDTFFKATGHLKAPPAEPEFELQPAPATPYVPSFTPPTPEFELQPAPATPYVPSFTPPMPAHEAEVEHDGISDIHDEHVEKNVLG
jgi:hypothetical protein